MQTDPTPAASKIVSALKKPGYVLVHRQGPGHDVPLPKQALAQRLMRECPGHVYEDEDGTSEFETGSTLLDLQLEMKHLVQHLFRTYVAHKFHAVTGDDPTRFPRLLAHDPNPKDYGLVLLCNPCPPAEQLLIWPTAGKTCAPQEPVQLTIQPQEAVLIRRDTTFLATSATAGTSLLLAVIMEGDKGKTVRKFAVPPCPNLRVTLPDTRTVQVTARQRKPQQHTPQAVGDPLPVTVPPNLGSPKWTASWPQIETDLLLDLTDPPDQMPSPEFMSFPNYNNVNNNDHNAFDFPGWPCSALGKRPAALLLDDLEADLCPRTAGLGDRALSTDLDAALASLRRVVRRLDAAGS